MPKYREGIIENWAAGCTSRIPFSSCIYSISDIIHKDDPKISCNFLSDKKAWAADIYEELCVHGNREPSVDFVIGLDDGSLLMVESKFKVETINGSLKSEIEKKIEHTKRNLVSSSSFISYSKPSVVLFKTENFERMKNKFLKLRSYKTDIMPKYIKSFYDSYFE